MLKIKRIVTNMVAENCYIVSDESREALIVDCGAYSVADKNAIQEYISQEGLVVKHLVCTHAHFDHIFGCAFIADTYHVHPECHQEDADLYLNMDHQTQMFLGSRWTQEMPPLARILKEGDIISCGEQKYQVIHTPGHTPGGICLYNEAEKVLFTGDTLFNRSIGRTDFPGGDYEQLVQSVKKKLLVLPADVTVWPGHGPESSIGTEKKENPYF